jgi:hypothetical protein
MQRGQIALTELAKIPYLDTSNLRGRVLATLSFYVDGEWHFWIPAADRLVKLAKGSLPIEGLYFGHARESEGDVYLHFLDFLHQRASFPEIQYALFGLRDDFFNLSTSLAKLRVLHDARKGIDGVARMAATEIEYICLLARSVFDLLQEIIWKLWDTIQLHDKTVPKKQLKHNFREMIMLGEAQRTAEELESRFGLPSDLAAFYVRNAPFFLMLRTFRDNLVHHGSPVDPIFSTDRGFAVHESTLPFATFNVWSADHKQANGLCSLRPVIAYLIHHTLAACEDFTRTIERLVLFPPPLAPGFRIFLRGYYTIELARNYDVMQNSRWWDNDPPPEKAP